jgi:thimet oligopeptidase
MREDVYNAVKYVKEKEYDTLDQDQKRILDRIIRDYERNGLALDEEQRGKVKSLKGELSKLCIDFSKNIAEDKTTLLFTDEQLAGCPPDFIENVSV